MSITVLSDANFLVFVEFMLKNEPCIFGERFTKDWKSRKLWQKAGKPDLEYLSREFGMASYTSHASQPTTLTVSTIRSYALLFTY